MPDPTVSIDPEVEAAIEETRQYLKLLVKCKQWKADTEYRVWDLLDAKTEIENSSLTEKTKRLAVDELQKATLSRTKKPTRHMRNRILCWAAKRLEPRYLRSRNDVTRHTESASSIIQKALGRLGESMTEKQINDAVLKSSRRFSGTVLKKPRG
jgi:hypothetical protein